MHIRTYMIYAVLHGASGPYPTSEYEHSSIPATVKKIFNLPQFLTKRDAWAATFEGIIVTRKTPRTDCPGKLYYFLSFYFHLTLSFNTRATAAHYSSSLENPRPVLNT